MMSTNLSKQQALDANPKATQPISFTGNLKREGNENTTMFSILKKQKKMF